MTKKNCLGRDPEHRLELMVADQTTFDLPYIGSQLSEDRPEFCPLLQNSAGFLLAPSVDGMADEAFNHEYADGAFHYQDYQSMSNMQRFLKQEGPFLATRPIYDEQQPHFAEKVQSPIAPGVYGAPYPWSHSVNTAHDPCPQETWSSEWTSPDQESCSGAAGTPWSPQATESCSDHDPRYSWGNPHVYSAGYRYADYGSGNARVPAGTSSQSFTATLSEIQHFPDTDPEEGP